MLVPKLRVPFRVVGGRAQVIEQDTTPEIAQCAYAALATERGERLEVPEFGISDPTFRKNGVDLREVTTALNRWEPRAQVTTHQELKDLIAEVDVDVA